MLTFTQQRGQLFCLSRFIKPPPAKVTKQAGKPPSRPVIRFDKSPIIIDEFLIGAKHEFNWVRRCESEGTGWHRLGVKANINSRDYRKNDLVGKTSSPRWYWMKGSALPRSPLIIICFCSLKTNINITYIISLCLSLSLFDCDQIMERRSLGIEIWLKVLRRWLRQQQSPSVFIMHNANGRSLSGWRMANQPKSQLLLYLTTFSHSEIWSMIRSNLFCGILCDSDIIDNLFSIVIAKKIGA